MFKWFDLNQNIMYKKSAKSKYSTPILRMRENFYEENFLEEDKDKFREFEEIHEGNDLSSGALCCSIRAIHKLCSHCPKNIWKENGAYCLNKISTWAGMALLCS